MKKSLLKLPVVAVLLLASGSVFCDSTSANLAVSTSVSQNCTISTTALAFGVYDPVVTNAATALNASGSVIVTCPKGATGLTVGMDNSAHVLAAQRQMLGGTSAGLDAFSRG